MNHREWMQRVFKEEGQSLGFQFIPKQEIDHRIARVRARMAKDGIEAFLVLEKMDLYYLSGTTQDGLLFLPLEGKPLLMIKRELERVAERPTMQEWLERTRNAKPIPTKMSAARVIRELRDER